MSRTGSVPASPPGRGRRVLILALYGIVAALAVLVAPRLGRVEIAGGADPDLLALIHDMRCSRAALAAVAGAGLALAGVLLQSLLRNSLATPFTLGVASGASLGAVLALSVAGALRAELPSMAVTGAAMVGALAALGIVYLVARSQRGGLATETLLLAGVATSYFAAAVILFLLYSAHPTRTAMMLHWMIGAITDDPVLGWRRVLATGAFVVAGLVLALVLARDLNVLVFGDEVAAGRGLEVTRIRVVVYLTAGLVTAAVVAATGPIGFVGLIIPHLCRILTGPDHSVLVPAAVLTGAAFLPLCDALARSVLYPAQLPVGILTAAVGGPVFILLLVTRRRGAKAG